MVDLPIMPHSAIGNTLFGGQQPVDFAAVLAFPRSPSDGFDCAISLLHCYTLIKNTFQ